MTKISAKEAKGIVNDSLIRNRNCRIKSVPFNLIHLLTYHAKELAVLLHCIASFRVNAINDLLQCISKTVTLPLLNVPRVAFPSKNVNK